MDTLKSPPSEYSRAFKTLLFDIYLYNSEFRYSTCESRCKITKSISNIQIIGNVALAANILIPMSNRTVA